MTDTSGQITIVDCGRGPQLSTSRVTVQDLAPYFQLGCSSDEIIRWIPTLTADEIAVADRYYREHQLDLDEQDCRIRERSSLWKNSEWVEKVLADARCERLEVMENLRRHGSNGAPH